MNREEWAENYRKSAKFSIRLLEEFIPDIDFQGKRILDVGCWWGWFVKYAREKGAYVTGFDCATSRVNDAIDFIGGEGLCVADARHIPYRNKNFDVVFSYHVLEHVKEQGVMLQEIHRVLKDNGEIVLAVPNDFSLKALPYRPMRWLLNWKPEFFKKKKLYDALRSIAYSDLSHEKEYTRKSLCDTLRANRFEILDVRSYGCEFPYPVGDRLNRARRSSLSWSCGKLIFPWFRAAFIVRAKKREDRC